MEGRQHPLEQVGLLLPVGHGGVPLGQVQPVHLGAAGLGHAGGLGGLLHRGHVEHLLVLGGQVDLLRLQLRQLALQLHGLRGQQGQLHVVHQHHQGQPHDGRHAQHRQLGDVLPLPDQGTGTGLYLGLLLAPDRLARVAQRPLPDGVVQVIGQAPIHRLPSPEPHIPRSRRHRAASFQVFPFPEGGKSPQRRRRSEPLHTLF